MMHLEDGRLISGSLGRCLGDAKRKQDGFRNHGSTAVRVGTC